MKSFDFKELLTSKNRACLLAFYTRVIQEVMRISFIIAIFQDSLHQNNDALSIFPNPITNLTESHSNPRCLATRECKVNDLGHGKHGFYLCHEMS